jgi:hypothetical protein
MKVSATPATNVITKLLEKTIFRQHEEYKHEGVRYSCDQCEYKATTTGNLILNDSIHKGVCYPCGQCYYKATVVGSLKRHRKSNHQ